MIIRTLTQSKYAVDDSEHSKDKEGKSGSFYLVVMQNPFRNRFSANLKSPLTHLSALRNRPEFTWPSNTPTYSDEIPDMLCKRPKMSPLHKA